MNDVLNDSGSNATALHVDSTTATELSLNELESLCSKAARGVGMNWGHTEEVGYAAAWLALRSLDAASLLVQHLRSVQGKQWQDICPVVKKRRWSARLASLTLCPIALGTTLSDHICVDTSLLEDDGLNVEALGFPALVLPFLAMVAESSGKPVQLHCASAVVSIKPDGMLIGDISLLMKVTIADVVIRAVDLLSAEQLECSQGPTDQADIDGNSSVALVNADALEILQQFSLLTTVPSSAASRANAGASTSDND